MHRKIEFGCLPTAIGSMPHVDPQEAIRLVVRYLSEVPAWPQLPRRAHTENMYAQFSEGFPGVLLDDSSHLSLDRTQDLDSGLEKLHLSYLDHNPDGYDISREYAAGLHTFLEAKGAPLAVKGQVTGPISWGLSMIDQGRYAIYDDGLAEAMARHLALKAGWQEQALSEVCQTTIIFVDEPYLTSLGSAFVSLPAEKVSGLLAQTLAGIRGLRGVHCCGSTDWSLVLGLPIDILSFDTYNYAGSLAAYTDEVQKFLSRGGTVAWGAIPNDEESLSSERIASLRERLEEALAQFVSPHLTFRQLARQSLITPACGLATLSYDAAEQVLGYLRDLSADMRTRYV